MSKSNAERSKAKREKLKAQGLVPMEAWVLPENKQGFKNSESVFRTASAHQLLIEFKDDLLNGLSEIQHKNKWGKSRDFELEERITSTIKIIRKICED